MDYRYLGKIVNTHGIKGEIRILSDFEKKELVFFPGFNLYIGEEKEKVEIVNFRHHKEYDMVTLKGFNNINEVLRFKGKKVYFNRNDLKLDDNEYLYSDLIELEIWQNNQKQGIIRDIINNNGNVLLEIQGEKKFYIPLYSNFIVAFDWANKKVVTKNIEELKK